MPPHKDRSSRGSGATVVMVAVLLVVLLPVLYVLSAGPVIAVYGSYDEWPTLLQVAYWPLRWLCEVWPTFNSFMNYYGSWWTD